MARLIYSAIMSLDGYVADADGTFDWAAPDAEVHAHLNDHERTVGTYLLGRRTYEVMRVWDTLPLEGEPQEMRDFAELWRAADKIVYSTTLVEVSAARTRLERRLDPDAVRALVDDAERDVSIGGPGLAASAIRAGLVGEYRLYVMPVVVGGGTRALPDGVRASLELLEERRFAGGTVHLRYRTTAPTAPTA